MEKRNHTGHRVGQDHHRAKLSDEQVAKIRRMYKYRVVGYDVLAREFGCGASTIRDIVQYRTRA
jgi:DNA invertase Pin-like site-specific DNA recombinase